MFHRMSAQYGCTLPNVDHERTPRLQETTDRPLGLKVQGGAHVFGENMDCKSSSVEVITESSVGSYGTLNDDLMTKPESRESKDTRVVNEQTKNPQLLQSTTDVPTSTPPTDDKKLRNTLDLRPMRMEMDNPVTLSMDKCTDFILSLVKEKLKFTRKYLPRLEDWTDTITSVGYLGSPCPRSDDQNRETGITFRHGKHPKDTSSSLVILDTLCQPEESEGGLMKMSQLFVFCYIPVILWISQEDISLQRMCQAYIDIRENVSDAVAQKLLPKPDIHIIYDKRQQYEKERWQYYFLQKVKDLPYCHLHMIQMDENPSWTEMTSQQCKQLYDQQIQEMELEILSKCQPLSIEGALLNWKRFTELLEICVDEVNCSGTRTTERFLTNISDELSLLTDKYAKQYATRLKQITDNVLPVHENVLEREHGKLYESILEQFYMEALLTDDCTLRSKHGLQATIREIYQQMVEENKKLSAEKCQLLVEDCFRGILTKLDANIYHIKSRDYQKDLAQAIDKYKSTAGKGPQADKVLVSFMKSLANRKQKSNLDNGEPQSIPGANNKNATLSLTDEKSDSLQQSMSPSMAGSILRESQGRKKIGDTSVRIYSQVFALEQRNAELEEQLKNLLAEHNRKQQILADTPGTRQTCPDKNLVEVGVNTDEGHAILTSPVTSLSPQDAQWIHVDKQQQSSQKEPVCVCKEITEREVKLQNQNKKYKEKIKELAEANASWEQHCQTIQDGFTKQVSGLLDELHESKRFIKRLESEAEAQEEAKAEMEREAQKRVLEAEEQKTKAIGFASAQAEKVDELKRNLRKEKQHTAELEQRIQELQAQVAALNQRVEECRSQTSGRKQEVDVRQTSPRMPEELIHLSIDNHPPPSRDEHQQNSYRSHVTSLWESIPPSLLVEPQQANPCCQRLQQQLSQSETEIRVLQQQVTIYKDDFEKERRDRENAHSEIASLQSSCLELTQDIKVLQDRVTQKAREAEALKRARAQDQHQLREYHDQIAQLGREVERLKRQRHHVPQQPPPPYTEVPRPTANGPVDTPGDHSWEAMLMPQAWKQQLKKHYVTFANHMKPSEVINHMYARALLSYQEKVRLDAMDIDYKKVEYLYNNIVMKLTRPELLTFKQILTDNNQAALARLLPSEDYTGPEWHCPRCTYKNPANLSRCHMCQKRAPGVEPLGGVGAVEQCDADDAEWVEPARITSDTNTEEHRTMDSINSSQEDPRLEPG